MTIPSALIIVAVAALIHASFQLSVSMLTLLSGHTIGKKRSQARLLTLTGAFTLGAASMTMFLLSLAAILLAPLSAHDSSYLLWTISCGLLTGVGLAVWLFYYRRQAGTSLWVPRGMAKYLTERTKKTTHSAEAFSLGLASILGELLFVFAPITVSALAMLHLEAIWQLVGVIVYTVVASSSLLLVNLLVGGGYSLSRIQKWRETNKHFLQFAAGTGLIVLGFYIYVDQVTSSVVNVAAHAVGGA